MHKREHRAAGTWQRDTYLRVRSLALLSRGQTGKARHRSDHARAAKTMAGSAGEKAASDLSTARQLREPEATTATHLRTNTLSYIAADFPRLEAGGARTTAAQEGRDGAGKDTAEEGQTGEGEGENLSREAGERERERAGRRGGGGHDDSPSAGPRSTASLRRFPPPLLPRRRGRAG